MNKNNPVGSKLLNNIWKQRDQKIHKERIRRAKPMIDMAEPQKWRHISKKPKKE